MDLHQRPPDQQVDIMILDYDLAKKCMPSKNVLLTFSPTNQRYQIPMAKACKDVTLGRL